MSKNANDWRGAFRHGTIAAILTVLTVVTTAKGVAGAAKKGTGAAGIGAAEEATMAPGKAGAARITGEGLKQARNEFNLVKPKFWKREASANGSAYSAGNLARMQEGKAPIGADGHPMELHHKTPLAEGGSNAFENLKPLTRSEHRSGANYKLNHPNLP